MGTHQSPGRPLDRRRLQPQLALPFGSLLKVALPLLMSDISNCVPG